MVLSGDSRMIKNLKPLFLEGVPQRLSALIRCPNSLSQKSPNVPKINSAFPYKCHGHYLCAFPRGLRMADDGVQVGGKRGCTWRITISCSLKANG